MLINDERTTNGHTFWSPIFSLFGLLKIAFVDSRFLSLILSCKAANNPNIANSKFFICLETASHLDRNYTVFGKVTKGMEFVDMIKKGEGQSGSVSEPDKIISFKSE